MAGKSRKPIRVKGCEGFEAFHSIPNQQWFVLYGRGPVQDRSILEKFATRREAEAYLRRICAKLP